MNPKRFTLAWSFTLTLIGILISLFLLYWFFLQSAHWLVLKQKPVISEVAVVMGGGGGSRLRRAVQIYNEGLVGELILVGLKTSNWEHITRYLCPDCILTDKKVTILSGSSSTMTDAEMSLEYCKEQGMKKVLVVTDPYHTRRSALTFSWVFRESNIEVFVVSSGDYGKYLPPEGNWWLDFATLKNVWLELGKCFAVLFTQYLPRFHTA